MLAEECSGKEQLCLLQAVVLYRSAWKAERTLLANTAISVLSKLQRQQTRLLADYLQVFLNTSGTIRFSEALLASISSTLLGLQNILPPVSQEQHAHDNHRLLCCFALQLMLQHTLTQPLPQTQAFHRAPDYNADLPNHRQYRHPHSNTSLQLKLVQCLMKCLQQWHSNTCTQLASLLDSLHHSDGASKLPSVDDAAFLDVSQLEVCSQFN